MWGWIGLVVAVVVIYKIMKDRSSAASTTAAGTVGAANNALGDFGSEGFSENSAGEIVDNATGDILGTFGGTGGGTSTSTTNETWVANAQQALFNLGYNNANVDQALQDYESGQPLPQSEYSIIEAAINLVGNPPSTMQLPQLAPPAPQPAAAAPPAASAPVASALAWINASAWPTIVKFGQDPNAATDFTAIGSVNNGQYSGYNVQQGAPVYAGVFGGYAQDFDMSTLPNGTIIYAPTTLVQQGYLGSHT